jgi:glucarate dehydratase
MSTRIARIECWPVTLPLKGMFVSSHGARATTARTVVRLTTDDGAVGYGESFRGAATAHVIEQLRPRLIGRDVFAIESLQDDLRMVPFFFGYIGYAALAGIEMAMLDAIGRAKGVSLAEWLGGARRSHIPITGLLTRALGEDPAALGEAARQVLAEGGYRTLKVKGSHDADADAALCEGVRRAVGDGIGLRVDPNAAWSVPDSIRAGRRLEAIGMEWLEDPCPGLEGMAEVRRQVRMPLCTNMCVVRMEEVAPAVRMRAVDVIHADVHKWGGVAPTRRLAAICGAFGLGMSMHSGGEAGLSTACHLLVAAATPEINYAIDSMHEMLADDIVAEGPLPVRDGGFDVPLGPGMGVTVDPEKLRFYAERYEEENPTG